MGNRQRWASRPPSFNEDPSKSLSSREREILGIVATEGLSHEEIAKRLFLSVKTVRRHIENIKNKLGVNSTVVAVIWAWQTGFIQRNNELLAQISTRASDLKEGFSASSVERDQVRLKNDQEV